MISRFDPTANIKDKERKKEEGSFYQKVSSKLMSRWKKVICTVLMVNGCFEMMS
jgi:hypothetical protein